MSKDKNNSMKSKHHWGIKIISVGSCLIALALISFKFMPYIKDKVYHYKCKIRNRCNDTYKEH